MKVIRNNFFFLIVLCIAVAQISMMVLWKDHSFIAIHDNLDLFIAHNKMMKNEGVNESLKAADQMEWVRWMNNIRHRADETVLHELIYE